MKLKCLILHLKEALSLIEKISTRNVSLPILNSVLISSKKRELKIFATNLEVGLEIKIPAKIEKEGEIAIPIKIFYNFLSNISSNENIELESHQNNLSLNTENSSTLIKGYPVEDFPIISFLKEKEKSFCLPVKDFLSGLYSVSYAASVSEMKPEISSVLVYSQKNTPMTFVATDSFRLAKKTIQYNFSDFPVLLIPIKSVMEILRVFENENGEIEIVNVKNQIFLFSEKIKFVSRLTEGSFPDYEEIIPKSFSTEVLVEKNTFNNNLKIAGVFSGKLNEVKIEISPEKKQLKIQTYNNDFGEHSSFSSAEIKGEKVKIAFNHRYLIESLKFISTEKISLRFNGENKPLFITSVKDNSFYCLIMPMKDI